MTGDGLLLVTLGGIGWLEMRDWLGARPEGGFARLAARGSIAPLGLPRPRLDAALEAGLATGCRAHEHGVLEAGLWERSAFWEHTDGRVLTVGWSRPASAAKGRVEVPRGWSPEMVPEEWRFCRVAGDEIDDDVLRSVEVRPEAWRPDELDAFRDELAEEFSTQALTTLGLERDWSVIAARFGRPVTGRLSRRGAPPGWIKLQEMMVDRLAELAPSGMTALVVGLPAATDGVRRHAGGEAGFVLAFGAGVRAGGGGGAVSLSDLAPTALCRLGYEVPPWMRGRVLDEFFLEVRSRIPGPQRTHAAPPDRAELRERSDFDREWHRASSLLDAGNHADALVVLGRLFRCWPEHSGYGRVYLECLLEAGRAEEAAEVLEVLSHGDDQPEAFRLLEAWLHYLRDDPAAGRRLLEDALRESAPALDLGLLLYRLREWELLASLAESAAARDPDRPLVRLGLAIGHDREGRHEEAACEARRAVGLDPGIPFAHTVLGSSLAKLGRLEEARDSLMESLRLFHRDPMTIRILANVLRALGEPARAHVLERGLGER